MRFLSFIIGLIICTAAIANNSSGFDLELSKKRCAPPTADEPLVYNSDFKWHYTLEQMAQRFDEIYNSGKRLDARAFYDSKSDQFFLVHRGFNSTNLVKIGPQFIKSVTRHIEVSLENKYAEFIFFPDMGHSHLYFENTHWGKDYVTIPDYEEYYKHYEKMLNDPKMRALYHTAEQLGMKDKQTGKFYSDHYEFRFWHRNPVGDNTVPNTMAIYTAPQHVANSVGEIDGHHSWSAGYNISSSKDGCFAYKQDGKILYFDISLYDLPMDPKNPGELM
jgi:hypothetical protein